MGEQQLLLSVESILDIHPLHTFKILFDHLNPDDLDFQPISQEENPSLVDKNSLLGWVEYTKKGIVCQGKTTRKTTRGKSHETGSP